MDAAAVPCAGHGWASPSDLRAAAPASLVKKGPRTAASLRRLGRRDSRSPNWRKTQLRYALRTAI